MYARVIALLITLLIYQSSKAQEGAAGSRVRPDRAVRNQGADERIRRLEEEVTELRRTVEALVLQAQRLQEGRPGTLSTERDAYAVVQTRLGPFFVSQKGLVPYLDGYKVTLGITNPTSIAFQGMTLSITWGSPYDGGTANQSDASKKEKTFHAAETFPPGETVAVSVVLAPATPAEVKKLRVGLTPIAISVPLQ